MSLSPIMDGPLRMHAEDAMHATGPARASAAGSLHAGSHALPGGWAEFRQLLWRRCPDIGIITLALGTADLFTTYPLLMNSLESNVGRWVLFTFANLAFMLGIFVLALTACQQCVRGPWARMAAVGLSVLLTALATSSVRALFAQNPLLGLGDVYGDNVWSDDTRGLFLYFFWVAAASGSLLAVFYESQMRTEQVNAALDRIGFENENAERDALESRLNTLKARVEPEFLFDVITGIESFYGRDPATAEQLLEDLIEFLRAALPHAPSAGTSLRAEVEFCAAYLSIERHLRGDALSVQTKVEATLGNVAFPPSLLLPLVHALLPPREQGAAQVHVLIAVELREDFLQVELSAGDRARFLPGAVLTTARSTLQGFFGERASLTIGKAPFGGQSVLVRVIHAGA